MIGWLVRGAMLVAGVIAGWFVARDAAKFGLLQMMISLLLITAFLAIAAFWPSWAAWFRNRRGP
jgi:hypothetical protein